MFSIFRKKSKFNIETSDLEGFQGADIIYEIHSGLRDGVIIKSIFSEKELEVIRQIVHDGFPEKYVCHSEVYSFPHTFSSFVNSKPSEVQKEAYFNQNQVLLNSNVGLFGPDFIDRILLVFKRLSNNREFDVPEGQNGIGNYPPFTTRILTPKGKLLTHCGNYFYAPYYDFYQHLEKHVYVKNQLSFFVLVTAPKAGGELVLYNLRWVDGQKKKEDEPSFVRISNPDGTLFKSNPLRNKNSEDIKMEAGDLIIFSGGEIWHKVSQTEGPINRITIGGFLGKSKNKDNKIYYWS